jgi:hypothetical protein
VLPELFAIASVACGAKDQLKKPRLGLAARMESEVKKRWQPPIRAKALEKAATTGGIVMWNTSNLTCSCRRTTREPRADRSGARSRIREQNSEASSCPLRTSGAGAEESERLRQLRSDGLKRRWRG